MADKEFSGSALYATWVYSGGTVVMSTDSRNLTATSGMEFIDATAGADIYRRRLASFKDYSVTIEHVAQTDGTALITACSEGTGGTLVFGEAGTATGSPKVTMPAICMGISRNIPYSDVVTYSITWENNGSVVYGTY